MQWQSRLADAASVKGEAHGPPSGANPDVSGGRGEEGEPLHQHVASGDRCLMCLALHPQLAEQSLIYPPSDYLLMDTIYA